MRYIWLLLLTVCTVTGCGTPPTFVSDEGLNVDRTTRVSFRPEGNYIYSTPYIGLGNVVPAGLPARVTKFSAQEVHVEIDQIPYVMYPIEGQFNPSAIDEFYNKYFVASKEDLELDAMEKNKRDSALAGTHMIGMTKKQILIACGIPAQIDLGTPTINVPLERIMKSNRWIYRVNLIAFIPTETVFTFYEGKLQNVQ